MIWDFSPKYRFLIHQRNDIMKSRPAQCNYFIRNVVCCYLHNTLHFFLPPLLFKLQEFVQYSFVGLSVSVHGGGWNKIKKVYPKIRLNYSNNDFIFSANMGRWIKMSKVLFKYSISGTTVLTIDYPTPSRHNTNCTILV